MLKKLVFAVCLCLMNWSVGAVDFPALTGQVVDEAGILTPQTEQQILSMLKPNQQFVVVTLKSLRGLEIEDYGVELGRHWGIGDEKADDGVLLIVAPSERQTRIEVGYGLEHILTDAQSALIVQNILLPAFRNGDYNGGIVKASEAITKIIAGQQVDLEYKLWKDKDFWIFLLIFIMGVFVLLRHPELIFFIGSGRGGHGGGFGGFSGGGGSFGGGGASGRW